MTQQPQQKIEISKYFSDDGIKEAIVCKLDGRYVVDFYENAAYNHSIVYNTKSLQYVEDAAENYVLGIFKNIHDFKREI